MLSYIDIYGQVIKFSNHGSQIFSTSTGKILTLIIYLILLLYVIILLVEISSREFPQVIDFTEVKNSEFNYTFHSDYPSLFEAQADTIPDIESSERNSSYNLQWAIGFIDTRNYQYRVIDPSYFWISITNNNVNNTDKYMYFDYCKRFYKSSSFDFQNLQLNKTYCIYSDFQVSNEVGGKDFEMSYLSIDLHRCVNDKNYYLPKSRHESYPLLFLNYLEVKYPDILKTIISQNDDLSFINDTTDQRVLYNIDSESNDNYDISLRIKKVTKYIMENHNRNPNTTNSIIADISVFINNANNININNDKSKRNLKDYLPYEDEAFFKQIYFSFPYQVAEKFNTYYFKILKELNLLLEEIFKPVNVTELLPNSTELLNNPTDNPYLREEANRLLFNENKFTRIPRYLGSSSDQSLEKVVCASDDDIDDLLRNLQVVFIYTDQTFNLTSTSSPVTNTVRRDFFFTTKSIVSQYTYQLSIHAINSFNSAIFNSLSPDHNDKTEYALIFSDNDSIIEPKKATSSVQLKLLFKTNKSQVTYVRYYKTVLNVAGLVGGVYNIMLFLGMILFTKYVNFRYIETMINRSYCLSDPSKEDYNLEFEEFLRELEHYYDKLSNNYHFSETEILRLRKIVCSPSNTKNEIEKKELFNSFKNDNDEVRNILNDDTKDLVCVDSALTRFFKRDIVYQLLEYIDIHSHADPADKINEDLKNNKDKNINSQAESIDDNLNTDNEGKDEIINNNNDNNKSNRVIDTQNSYKFDEDLGIKIKKSRIIKTDNEDNNEEEEKEQDGEESNNVLNESNYVTYNKEMNSDNIKNIGIELSNKVETQNFNVTKKENKETKPEEPILKTPKSKKKIIKLNHTKTIKDNSISKIVFLQYQIIYEIFRFKVRQGLFLSYSEAWVHLLCCFSICKNKRIRTLEMAAKHFNYDKDFSELIYSCSDFNNILNTILDKEQQYIFNSIPGEKIDWNDTNQYLKEKKAKNEIDDEEINKDDSFYMDLKTQQTTFSTNSNNKNSEKRLQNASLKAVSLKFLNKHKEEGLYNTNDFNTEDLKSNEINTNIYEKKIRNNKTINKLNINHFIGRSVFQNNVYQKMRVMLNSLLHICDYKNDRNLLNENLLREISVDIKLKNDLISAINNQRLYYNKITKVNEEKDERNNSDEEINNINDASKNIDRTNKPGAQHPQNLHNNNEESLNEKDIEMINRLFQN